MTEQEAVDKIAKLDPSDPERYHIDCEDTLLTFLDAQGFKTLSHTYNCASAHFWDA